MKMLLKAKTTLTNAPRFDRLSLSYLDANSRIVILDRDGKIIDHFRWSNSRVANFTVKHDSIVDTIYGKIYGVYSLDGEFFVVKVETKRTGYFDADWHEELTVHDELLANEVYIHGTAAFNTNSNDLAQIIDNTRTVIDMANSKSNGEICAALKSDVKFLGDCGVALQGIPVVASRMDLFSFRNEDGTRTFSLGDLADTLCANKVALINKKGRVSCQHSEIVLKPRRIVALWCKRTAPLKLRTAMLKLAREVGVKMILLRT